MSRRHHRQGAQPIGVLPGHLPGHHRPAVAHQVETLHAEGIGHPDDVRYRSGEP
jgi:hypothetical protein